MPNPNIIAWDEDRRRPAEHGFSLPFVNRDACGAGQLSFHVTGVRPGQRAHPPHTHAGEEILYVLEGQAEATIGEDLETIGPGTALFCPEHVLHGLRNTGDGLLRYMVVRVLPEFAGQRGSGG